MFRTGLLRVTDGTHAANFTFDNFDGTFSFASDGHGGTIITDPPAASSTSPSVSIGGAGNDTFVFHPGEGAQTVNNFNPQHDTIELDHFANIQNVRNWRRRSPRTCTATRCSSSVMATASPFRA